MAAVDVVARVEALWLLYRRPYRTISLTEAMSALPNVPDITVHLALNACFQHQRVDRRLDFACLVALRYNRADKLLHSAPSLVPEPLSALWSQALTYLATQNRWSCVRTLIGRSSAQAECLALFQWMTRTSLQDDQAVTVLETLVARCSEAQRMCLEEIVLTVVELGCVDQFKVLVYSKNTTIRQLVLYNLSNLLRYTCRERLNVLSAILSNEAADHNGCLAVACEAGLLTVGPEPCTNIHYLSPTPCTTICLAALYNQPDLVHFLYYGAAANHRELLYVSRHPSLVSKTTADPTSVSQGPPPLKGFPSQLDVDAAQTIERFLTKVASKPRPLTTLCLHQVSRHLGWGHGREGNIQQLDIPDNLKEDLKFRDLKLLLKNKSR